MYVQLGKIVGVWGVKGWVKLHSFTRDREDIAAYSHWYLTDVTRDGTVRTDSDAKVSMVNVLSCRQQGQGVVAQLKDIDDRDQASALTGKAILVKASDLPKLADNEYYWHELIGLDVVNTEGLIGYVNSMLETGANDVLVITAVPATDAQVNSQLEEKTQDILVPYVPEVVQAVDLDKKQIVVDWDLSYLDD